jgi:hypothetical protein
MKNARSTTRPIRYSYTVRAHDGAPEQRWESEVWFNGREERVDITLNTHPYADDLETDAVRTAVSYRARTPALAYRIATALIGAGKTKATRRAQSE